MRRLLRVKHQINSSFIRMEKISTAAKFVAKTSKLTAGSLPDRDVNILERNFFCEKVVSLSSRK